MTTVAMQNLLLEIFRNCASLSILDLILIRKLPKRCTRSRDIAEQANMIREGT